MAARARIIIAGESQCLLCTQVCLVAGHLARNLPNFCYETIIRPVSEWEAWLRQINSKNKWHHLHSPLVWKELILNGSKQYYIGGASEFWDYCHAYYNFDAMISEKLFNDLENSVQYVNKIKTIKHPCDESGSAIDFIENGFVICITGAEHKSIQQLISGILDISDASTGKKVSKIYLYDSGRCETLEAIEKDCNYVGSHFPSRVVKAIDKLGCGLVGADLLIVMDHVPHCNELKLHDWLDMNYQKMKSLAKILEFAASPKTNILFPNFGPSCFNATVLQKATNNKNNIVVCTSDLGLEALVPASEIADIPLQTLFCPPVWGFVGINHIVDIKTTHHKYYSFYPYERIVRTRDSTLKIGTVTPEIRNLEYLMLWDKSLWLKVSQRKRQKYGFNMYAYTIEALIGTIKLWFFDDSLNKFTNMGVACDGSFGLTLDGIFSQPVQLINGQWIPAANLFPMPRDPYIKVHYFEKISRELIENHITEKMSKERYAKTLIDEEIERNVSTISFTYDMVDELLDGHIVCKLLTNEIIDEAVLFSFNELVKSTKYLITKLIEENISDGSFGNMADNSVDVLKPNGSNNKPIYENSSVSGSENLERLPEQLIQDNLSEKSSDYMHESEINSDDDTLYNQSSLSQVNGISDNSFQVYSENNSDIEI